MRYGWRPRRISLISKVKVTHLAAALHHHYFFKKYLGHGAGWFLIGRTFLLRELFYFKKSILVIVLAGFSFRCTKKFGRKTRFFLFRELFFKNTFFHTFSQIQFQAGIRMHSRCKTGSVDFPVDVHLGQSLIVEISKFPQKKLRQTLFVRALELSIASKACNCTFFTLKLNTCLFFSK